MKKPLPRASTVISVRMYSDDLEYVRNNGGNMSYLIRSMVEGWVRRDKRQKSKTTPPLEAGNE
jgi:hypothetical protein